MNAREIVDQLAEHKMLGGVARAELEWLAAHGFLRELKTGELTAEKGKPIEGMWIVLKGRLAIFVDRGAGPKKMMEWRAGEVSGMLPYSAGEPSWKLDSARADTGFRTSDRMPARTDQGVQ
jgi:hypothetical protein